MDNSKEHHTCQSEQTATEDTKADAQVNNSRRKFAASGIAATSVLFSLASRPVLGGGFECKSPSGFQSGNLSQHGTPQYCSGRTPGYWGTHGGSPNKNKNPYPGDWAGTSYNPGTWVLCTASVTTNCCNNSANTCGYWSGGTMFCSVFQCSGYGSIYSGKSMMQVIWGNGGNDPYQLGAHICSALLNAAKGLTPPLTVQAVINMFNEWNAKGYFEPTAGVKWYAADIVTYLKTTMPI